MGRSDDRAVRQLRLGSYQRPIVSMQGVPRAYIVLIVGRGNQIATLGSAAIYGLASTSSPITTVPVAVPPSIYTDDAYTDGLSPAEDLAGNMVWISSRLRLPGASSDTLDLGSSLPAYTPIVCRFSYNIPVTGSMTGETGKVYLPYSL